MARFAFTEEWMSLRASRILPLLARDHEIHYISSGEEVPVADFASVTLFKFPKYQLQNSPIISAKAWEFYRKKAVDFVVDYSYTAFLLPQVPFIEIVGGLYLNDFLHKKERAAWYQLPKLAVGYMHYCFPERQVIRRARRIITDNLVNAEVMSTRMSVDMGKIDIIPNGASEEFAAVYTTHKTARPKLLFVGTLHPRKGILPVLRRFVEKKDLEVEFVVCGDGPLRAEVESLAASDVRIDYRGRVNHETLVSIHRETNIFVFPSLAEGCPNALLEAMASGHACITYDVDTVNTTIVDAGVKCTPNGVDEVMVAIERLVGDPALLCSRIAAAHARSQHFSWEYTAGRVNEVIGMMTRNVIAAQGVGIS